MSESNRSRLNTAALYTGIYLMSATCAVPYIWGNLNAYTVSYFLFRVNIDMGSDASWILAMNSMAWGIGMMTGAYFVKYFGFRAVMIGSQIVFSASMAFGFYAINYSFNLLKILLGIVCGLTFGVNQALQTTLILLWMDPKRMGFGLCCVMLVQHCGSMLISLVLTRYVNPTNIPPDFKGSTVRLFSQRMVLDNVPYMFIVYGSIQICIGIVASALVWTKTPKTANTETEYTTVTDLRYNDNMEKETLKDGIHRFYNTLKGARQSGKTTRSQSDLNQHNIEKRNSFTEDVDKKCIGKSLHSCYGQKTVSDQKDLHDKLNVSATTCHYKEGNTLGEHDLSTRVNGVADIQKGEPIRTYLEEVADKNNTCSTSNFSVKRVLKNKNFYVMLAVSTYADVTCTILNTYYKVFGLLFYPDDHFFTSMGVWMNLGTAMATCLSGFACDRFQVKNVIVTDTAILCLASSFFYLAARINKWLYLILGVIYSGCGLSVYIMTSVCVSRYFDTRHTTTILGMAQISLYFTNTLLPGVASYILSTWGWLQLFTFVSLVILAGLLVVVLVLEHREANSKAMDSGSIASKGDS